MNVARPLPRPHPKKPAAAYELTRLEYESARSGIGLTAHRELVRLALASGKRVPAEVLADYPSLLMDGQPAVAACESD